ncbi:MAG: transposase [Pirellulales bacterium]|nr:transposase [Pirellulales bacterium]
MSESKHEASVRRRFDDEFKQSAVRLIVEEQYTFKAAAAAVGVSDQTLRAWHARFAPQPSVCGENATVEELRAENRAGRKVSNCCITAIGAASTLRRPINKS